jgi:uncharacterized phage protein (TIGR01671 family)
MRDIKVKAWNKDLKQFFYVSDSFSISLHDTGNTVIMWSSDGIVDEFPADEIMQFTGLTDKNGVEIYEGDILASEWVRAFAVEFGECDASIQGSICEVPMLAFNINGTPLCTDEEYEVVGNKYENPNLLIKK